MRRRRISSTSAVYGTDAEGADVAEWAGSGDAGDPLPLSSEADALLRARAQHAAITQLQVVNLVRARAAVAAGGAARRGAPC